MRSSVIAAATLASVAYAQSLSNTCITQVGLLAIGDLGSCLAIEQLIPLLGGTSDPVTTVVNNYLGALCQSDRTRCSNSTLESASSTIQSACSEDLQATGDGAAAASVLETVLESYPEFYTAACSRNETTDSYCVTSTLQAIQNATGQTLDVSFVSNILSGDNQALEDINNALDSGELCTGCVAGIYRQAVAANATVAELPAAQSIVSRCGEGFGSSAQETGVSSSSLPSGSSSASSSASSAPASSDAENAGTMATGTISFTMPGLAAMAVIAGGVLAGGATIL